MPFVTVVVSLMALAGGAEARLGETLAECEVRYGPVVEKRAAEVKESDPEACVFTKSGITAIVEFKGGVAWRILFRMSGLNANETESLLKANMPEGGWGAALTINGQECRLSEDRSRVAIHTPAVEKNEVPTLEVATRDYARASYAGYSAKVSDLLSQKRARKSEEGLKGF